MDGTALGRLLLAAAVVAVVAVIAALTWAKISRRRRGGFASGGVAPYGLPLTDSPHFYPYYKGREYTTWDVGNRCVAYCRAAEDGGCAVVCR